MTKCKIIFFPVQNKNHYPTHTSIFIWYILGVNTLDFCDAVKYLYLMAANFGGPLVDFKCLNKNCGVCDEVLCYACKL